MQQHNESSQDEKLRMRSHLIIFALALLFMLVAGSIALYRYMRQHQSPHAQAAWAAQGISLALAEPGITFLNDGEFHSLRPFRIGLGGPSEVVVLLEVVIEHKKYETVKKELERRDPQLREIILFAVQRKSREFFLEPGSREILREEIRIEINRVMRRKIDEIHIPSFSVQHKRGDAGMRY